MYILRDVPVYLTYTRDYLLLTNTGGERCSWIWEMFRVLIMTCVHNEGGRDVYLDNFKRDNQNSELLQSSNIQGVVGDKEGKRQI